MIKTFWKDESAVAVIYAYAILAMGVMGISYLVLQDVKDMIVPLYATLSPMAGYLNDADSQGGAGFLIIPVRFLYRVLCSGSDLLDDPKLAKTRKSVLRLIYYENYTILSKG